MFGEKSNQLSASGHPQGIDRLTFADQQPYSITQTCEVSTKIPSYSMHRKLKTQKGTSNRVAGKLLTVFQRKNTEISLPVQSKRKPTSFMFTRETLTLFLLQGLQKQNQREAQASFMQEKLQSSKRSFMEYVLH